MKVLESLLENIPESYVDNVWEIEFTDLDKQIDHELDWDDYELPDFKELSRKLLLLHPENFELSVFGNHIRKLFALFFRYFTLASLDEKKSAKMGFSCLQLFLRLLKSTEFRNTSLLQAGISMITRVFCRKSSKRKPDDILKAFTEFCENEYCFRNSYFSHRVRFELIQAIFQAIENTPTIYRAVTLK